MEQRIVGMAVVVCGMLGCGPRDSVGDLGGGGATAGTGASGTAGLGGGAGSGAAMGGAGSSQNAVPCGTIDYPAATFYGPNVLATDATTFTASPPNGPGMDPPYDFAAQVSSGVALSIRITALDWTPLPVGPPSGPQNVWIWSGGVDQWKVSILDNATGIQTFEGNDMGALLELQFGFLGTGRALVEYLECGSPTPTHSKTISWGP